MLKVFESFAGLGSQSIALENIGIEHEVVAISEIDKYATLSYDALHEKDIEVEEKSEEYMLEYLTNRNIGRNEKSKKCIINKKEIKPLYEASVRQNNLGDISLIDVKDIPQHDLFTISSPCTDWSGAGKAEGGIRTCKECGHKFSPFQTRFKTVCPNCNNTDISKTRSSLLVESAKVIEGCKPKYLFMENVKNLLSKKFKPFFDERCKYLESLNYTNYYAVLNGKDFGIPQNRERVFMISILGEHEPYEFPTGFPLELRLKDVLEENVDEKYFLPQELQDRFLPKDIQTPKDLQAVRICGLFDTEKSRHQAASVWDKNYLAPTLDTAQGGYREPCIVETPCIAASRGRNPDNPGDRRAGIELEQRLEINREGMCNTLTSVTKDNYVIQSDFMIRRLTPRECMRLMGFKDCQIDKLYSLGISDTQMYKMAGNSIIVDVLEYIFRNLFLKGDNNA